MSKFKVVLLLTCIVLFGYWKVFLGANFFLHEDHLAISNYAYGNSLGNGWRPDKGFGISAFFGDGIWHPWAPFSLLENFVHNRTLSYTVTIILLGILAAFVQYQFILRVVPTCPPLTAVFLSSLIVFSADQAGSHFLRMCIVPLIIIPLMLLLLEDYFKKPMIKHIFQTAGLFVCMVAFGNLWFLTQMWMVCFVFTIAYGFYFKTNWLQLLRKFFLLFAPATLMFLMLSAWLIYPFLLEKFMTGYVREKTLAIGQIFHWKLNALSILNVFMGMIQTEWWSHYHDLVGFGFRPFPYTFNIAVIFPILFWIVVAKKNKEFWPSILTTLLLVFLIHQLGDRAGIIPFYSGVFEFLLTKSSMIFTMYGFIFCLQIPLIAYVLCGHVENKEIRWVRAFQMTISVILFTGFLSLSVFALIKNLVPDFWINLFNHLSQKFPEHFRGYDKDFVVAVCQYNIARFSDLMTWPAVGFYTTSTFISGSFLFLKRGQLWFEGNSTKRAGFLLANGILLCWTIFPLNQKELVWDRQTIKRELFHPMDRFYYVEDYKEITSLGDFKSAWSDVEGGGHHENLVGMIEPPGLNISGLKSYASQAEGDFVYRVFNGDGVERLKNLRLYYGGPLRVSPLLDMAAVQYYYSDRPLKEIPDQLQLFLQDKQLYVYRNFSAWPYFYLARRIERTQNDLVPDKPIPGTAYLNNSDYFDLPAGITGIVKLKHFAYGKLTFDYHAEQESLLVIADAWHPFWKATAQGKELKIVKANQLFKAVRIPPGTFDVVVYFDTSPYRLGIVISLISCLFFMVFYWKFLKVALPIQ